MTLLVFLHPHCPCSRATVREVERILAESHCRLASTFVFVKPAGTAGDWAMTGLWRMAADISGAVTVADAEGREASLFQVETSGTVLLYRPDGRLAFAGGVTSERGHDGPNAGIDAISALVRGASLEAAQSAVFGCTLMDQECEKTAVARR